MISYGHQSINRDDIGAVIKVLRSNWLTQGPKIIKFERSLANYCGAKYAIIVNNGTAALHLAYLVAGLRDGDEIITTPNTFVATTNMMLVRGVKPTFCDIRLDTYNIDENKIKKLIGGKTRAIVPVHFAGHPCEMDKIKDIADKYNLFVIEDACHALGAKYKKSKIGDCKYSDLTVFSFHPVKSITTGEGGAILTNNKIYYEKIVHLRSHGVSKDKKGKNIMTELGYNYRMSDIQAALGLNQLKRVNNFIKKRHLIASWYQQELKNVKEVILPKELPHNYSSWHIYVIRTTNPIMRDKLMARLKKGGIDVNFHYPAVYSHPYYRNNGYRNFRLKNMEEYQNSCITLPCNTRLAKSDIKHITRIIKDFLDK